MGTSHFIMSVAALGLFDFISLMTINHEMLFDEIHEMHSGNVPYWTEQIHTIPGADMDRNDMMINIAQAQHAMGLMNTCKENHPYQEDTLNDDIDLDNDQMQAELDHMNAELEKFKEFMHCLEDIDYSGITAADVMPNV